MRMQGRLSWTMKCKTVLLFFILTQALFVCTNRMSFFLLLLLFVCLWQTMFVMNLNVSMCVCMVWTTGRLADAKASVNGDPLNKQINMPLNLWQNAINHFSISQSLIGLESCSLRHEN